MFTTRQTILASRPAAMILALSLVAGLAAPFMMLPRVQAAPATLPCAEGNSNGCTELSPTPPEDTVSVPPNVVLMLDDSGSMDYDYMPDWDYLANTSLYGVRNAAINGVYYNPAKVYTPPPRADGTLYPDSPSLTEAYRDGFVDNGAVDVTNYTASQAADNNHQFRYWENLATTEVTYTDHDYGPAVWGGGTPGSPGSPGGCPNGYRQDPGDSSQCIRDPVPPTTTPAKWVCNSGDGNAYNDHGVKMCHHYVWEEGRRVDHPYEATYVPAVTQCPSGSTLKADGKCHYPDKPIIPPTPPTDPTPDYKWVCADGSPDPANAPHPGPAPECKSRSGSRKYVHAFTYAVGTPVNTNQHFVIPRTSDAPADGWCSVLYYAWQKNNCVNADDTSGTAAPTTNADGTPAKAQDGSDLNAGQNVANWFSYYRTRMLMSKTSLMTAFTKVGPNYRFGFGSINANGVAKIPSDPTPYGFDDSTFGGGSSNNQLAVVQPFGAGSAGCPDLPGGGTTCTPSSQKDRFWTWIANETADGNTPLRKALQGVGEYYKTSQPWTAMSSDPGFASNPNAQFTCRASYTILTTDGFWNGADPSVGNADNSSSGPYVVPPGGLTGYTPSQPFSDDQSNTLADVAMYYWQTDLSSMPNEVGATTEDPANWQHMTTYTVGLGFDPTGIQPSGTTVPQILAWAQGGTPIAGFSWPVPSSNNIYNIADLAHAAINGHGNFFNAKSPEELAAAFGDITNDINGRQGVTPAASVNASVLSLGALSFTTGYSTRDWSGMLEGVTLKTDGTVDQVLWLDGKDPNHASLVSQLDAAFHSSSSADYGARSVYTGAYSASGTFSAFQFNVANKASLDTSETNGLQSPALAGGNDTLDNRIKFLLGDSTYEGDVYRARSTILGAILRSSPIYVAGATSNYYDSWPSFGGVTAPESVSGVQQFDDFVTQQSTHAGMVYVGANDGMLHAFRAPVPSCTGTIGTDGNCSAYTFAAGAKQGQEAWAYVPRAVYANLGNLTTKNDFRFLPTVDGTPVTRDVFFSDTKWHTLLAGGVGLGGRGVYALDITNAATFSTSDVKWEFDSDMTGLAAGCVSVGNTLSTTCKASDLGYTVSKPNIGRLANGKWVVLVPNGYFPDCNTPDTPTSNATQCAAIAAEVPKDSSGNPYSALFVMDAETGKMIAELKTPGNISGVTSFGLSSPVLGDYNNDQIDDVAFAGDVQGNLWRFDLSDPTNPQNWAVTLVYKGLADASGHQGLQPITTMPHLFPDPTTNRFIVTFGTGKFLGLGDNSNTTVQALYGVRDDGATHSQADMQQQYLHETTIPAGATLPDGSPNPLAGASLRCVTGGSSDSCDSNDATHPATPVNDVPATAGGWYINLKTTTSDGTLNDAGERVVVSPGAIFASNTVVFETLITGSQSSDPCSPTTVGSIMALSAITGAPAGVSTLGGWPIVGGRISNARTSGSLPIVSALGGGQAYLPGTALSPGNNPISIDAPIWRRRSWQGIQQN